MTRSGDFEKNIADVAKYGHCLPDILPQWMIDLGINPGDLIISSEQIGSKSSENKTDVLIKFKKSPPLKISVKLITAAYFGNWYSHKRIIREFGNDIFQNLTRATTAWANQWALDKNASIFTGVSISFAKRTGNTFIDFTEIFDSINEVKKIIAGDGIGENVANCLYVSELVPLNIGDLIQKMSPINDQVIQDQGSEIKVVFRPINPMTEGSNRGKCIYTQFEPFNSLSSPTTITSLNSLMQLGKFVEVESNSLNHNRLLRILKEEFNIIIPLKFGSQQHPALDQLSTKLN